MSVAGGRLPRHTRPLGSLLRWCAVLWLPLGLAASCGYFDPLHPYDLLPADPAVTWQKCLGGTGDDTACCVQQTSDGGFVITGSTDSSGAGDFDLWLVKVDVSGNLEWEKTFGGGEEDRGRCVVQASDGGYVVAGTTRSFSAGEQDVYLVKANAEGEYVWSRTFGGTGDDQGWCVVSLGDDDGYAVTGFTSSFSGGTNDAYLIRTKADGSEEWSKTYGQSSKDDRGNCLCQTADDGFVIAGLAEGPTAGDTNASLIKTKADGSEEWTRSFGIEFRDYGTGVRQAADGGYVVVGYTRSFGAGDFDAWMIRTDGSGNELWDTTFGGAMYDRAEAVQLIPGGGFILAGMTRSSGWYNQAWLIRTDPAGAELWSRSFGGGGEDWGFSVQLTADGGFIMTGHTTSFGAGGLDAYLVYFAP